MDSSAAYSAELARSSKVSDRRRTSPKSAQNRSESLCDALWEPCRIIWAWFGPALGPNPAGQRRFPAGSLKVVGARLAQLSSGRDRVLEFMSGWAVVGRCPWSPGLLSYPPGPISRSVFLRRCFCRQKPPWTALENNGGRCHREAPENLNLEFQS